MRGVDSEWKRRLWKSDDEEENEEEIVVGNI